MKDDDAYDRDHPAGRGDLSVGDVITVAKTVNGKKVGYYLDPLAPPNTPARFRVTKVGPNETDDIALECIPYKEWTEPE